MSDPLSVPQDDAERERQYRGLVESGIPLTLEESRFLLARVDDLTEALRQIASVDPHEHASPVIDAMVGTAENALRASPLSGSR